MSYTRAWNENIPAGTEDKTLGDDRIREFKADIRERLATEHADITGSSGQASLIHLAGRCSVAFYGTTAEINSLSSPPQYAIAFDTTLKSWKYYTGSAWTRGDAIPSGTKMLFYQASAPAGWTQDTSVNDKVIRVTSGTGAGTGGSWTITGLNTDSHAHGLNSHTHGPGTLKTETISANDSFAGGSNSFPNLQGRSLSITQGTTAAASGDTALAACSVFSDGTWRPAYVDVIICTKD